ncbi:zeta toxin family protein [Frankia sp. AiPs1]|uniref:zeta toxin family protein n=1 Tax=Frankia sp. AiPs1 TaxID=573493 RepID=UPI002043E4D9|nr:zeta toxin family protein [Frankia sp. AiPs1]MCM3923075.1 zeta toxin family protein [Frankia sp. AiPs1]
MTPADFRGPDMAAAPRELTDSDSAPVHPEQSRAAQVAHKLDLLDDSASARESRSTANTLDSLTPSEGRHSTDRPPSTDEPRAADQSPDADRSPIEKKLDLLDSAHGRHPGPGTPADQAALETPVDSRGSRLPEPRSEATASAPDLDSWAVPDTPKTLPHGHPLLTRTDTFSTPARATFRENLCKEVIGETKPPEDGRPVLYLMGGGGASGKGHLLDALLHLGTIRGDDAVHLDPDSLKTKIPEFGEIVQAGDFRAAEVVHEESSSLAKTVLGQAMERRLNIIYDSTLGNPDKTLKLMDDAKGQGYEVHVFGVSADVELAVQRAATRGEQSGRYVPIKHQLDAHRGFSQGFERYAEKADSAYLYDTNSAPRQMAVKEFGGSLEILDPRAYERFQAKSDINPDATGPATLYIRRDQEGQSDGR